MNKKNPFKCKQTNSCGKKMWLQWDIENQQSWRCWNVFACTKNCRKKKTQYYSQHGGQSIVRDATDEKRVSSFVSQSLNLNFFIKSCSTTTEHSIRPFIWTNINQIMLLIQFNLFLFFSVESHIEICRWFFCSFQFQYVYSTLVMDSLPTCFFCSLVVVDPIVINSIFITSNLLFFSILNWSHTEQIPEFVEGDPTGTTNVRHRL